MSNNSQMENFSLPFNETDDEQTIVLEIKKFLMPYVEFGESQKMNVYKITNWTETPMIRLVAPDIVGAVAKFFVFFHIPENYELFRDIVEVLMMHKSLFSFSYFRSHVAKMQNLGVDNDKAKSLPFIVMFLVNYMTSDCIGCTIVRDENGGRMQFI